eukprot:36661-Chlamydomonas_euryale.AAC.4
MHAGSSPSVSPLQSLSRPSSHSVSQTTAGRHTVTNAAAPNASPARTTSAVPRSASRHVPPGSTRAMNAVGV